MRRFAFILFPFLFVFLYSCGSTYTLYSTPINQVESKIYSNNAGGDAKVVDYSNVNDKYGYEDEFVKFSFVYTKETIAFNLLNKSDHTIKINWDEIIYINPYNASCKVIHQGVKYINKDNIQTPTYIGRKSVLQDQLLPVDHIYWLDMEFSGIWMFAGKRGGWNITPIFPEYDSQKEANLSPLNKKSIYVIFPIYIGDEKHEYTFKFVIDKIVVTKD